MSKGQSQCSVASST
jgi:hypothetical protein